MTKLLRKSKVLCVLLCGIWLAPSVSANVYNGSHNVDAASTKFSAYTLLVQDRVISGTIKDELGGVLPGANVVIKGTTVGTTTDGEGKFSLSVPSNATVLVVSYIGYAPQEIALEGR